MQHFFGTFGENILTVTEEKVFGYLYYLSRRSVRRQGKRTGTSEQKFVSANYDLLISNIEYIAYIPDWI